MRVSECVCVSEEGGREGGGGGRGADTELKTKTPHVNVGNKIEQKLVHDWLHLGSRRETGLVAKNDAFCRSKYVH